MKVTRDNIGEIDQLLSDTNGKASSHTFTASQIIEICERHERYLEKLGIPKAMRAGAEVIAISGSKVPSKYRHKRIATRAIIRRTSSGWRLGVQRVEIWPNEGGTEQFYITETQHEKAIGVFNRQFSRII